MFPANNPDTKSPTLYPAEQKEGKWFVEGRYVPYIPKEPQPKAMKGRSGEIATTTPEPVKKRVFDGK
jgi:hypothetical protein